MYSEQSQQKDSHRLDTTVSLTGTSLCTYAIEPPCTERYARWCERTGLVSPSYSIATNTVPDVGSKLNHDFKDYVSNGDATCEQDGTKTAKCVRYGQGGCTATDTVPDTGSKLGHDFTDYVYNNDATYTEDGTETAHCNHAGCNKTHTRRAEGTRWALFQVTDERGWYVTYAESRSGNVLTITVNQNTATLSGTIAGLRVLQASGITTVIFKTTEAESTFHIADLLSGTNYNLTHKDTEVTFNLDGNDIAALLK